MIKATETRAGHTFQWVHLSGVNGGSSHRGHPVRDSSTNFLTATDKAKATEAKTMIAATLKQAHALFLENGEDPQNTEHNNE